MFLRMSICDFTESLKGDWILYYLTSIMPAAFSQLKGAVGRFKSLSVCIGKSSKGDVVV